MTPDVVDAHAHVALHEPLKDLIMQMDMTSVDMAVILFVAEKDVGRTQKYHDFIADTVKGAPDRFIGFGSVHPDGGKKALEELDRFPDLGLKGVKFHPLLQNFHCNSEEMDTIAKRAEDLDIPLLIHSYFPYNRGESEGLYKLITNHPGTTFILAHVGGPAFLECYAYVERRRSGVDNVYFEVSSVSVTFRRSPYREHLKWLLEQMGADRVMFGSDYPRYQVVDALAAFDELELSFKDSQQILGKTIANLLKL